MYLSNKLCCVMFWSWGFLGFGELIAGWTNSLVALQSLQLFSQFRSEAICRKLLNEKGEIQTYKPKLIFPMSR